MDLPRHILPSQLPLDDTPGLLRLRQPLSDATGNSQLQNLASIGLHHDNKGHRPRAEAPRFSIPTVSSQPPQQTIGNTLGPRWQSTRSRRNQRFQRYGRNPIVDSPQYQAYRARQNREGNADDAKWPLILEEAFLDALLQIPPMGRRKFSFKGKPHGRNELIKEYLWIAYLQSLAPGQCPDETMQRTRKQVSSHIQVLKGFLKEHPAFDRLFPDNRGPKNGFEDSFKHDPCLMALSEGRLPSSRYETFDNRTQISTNHPIATRPVLFWLLITLDDNEYSREGNIFQDGSVAHRYTALSSSRHRDNLDSILGWQQRFPYLVRLCSIGDLDCDIIHMDVSLDLMKSHAPDGAELRTRTEIAIPGRDFERCQWQTVTSLIKPPELYRDPSVDPPMESKAFIADILSVNNIETRIKVPFPAVSWAHTFTCLTDLQLKYEENQRNHCGTEVSQRARPARKFTEQISMYQEVQSCRGTGHPFVRRAIILWTFRKVRPGEPGATTWRYLDATPFRTSCLSPLPQSSHSIPASMNENFNSFRDNSMQLPMLDPFVQDLGASPNTDGCQSPFTAYSYPQPYDMPTDHLSFTSTATLGSEATLIEESTNLDIFIATAGLDYEHNNPWSQQESFEAETAWANYTQLPSSTPQLGWEDGETWPEATEKPWLNENWGSPNKHESFDPNLEAKLLPWIEQPEEVKDCTETSETMLPDLRHGSIDNKEDNWVDSDGFDYSALAERLMGDR